MNNGHLLECPGCLQNGIRNILGSVTEDGAFIFQKWRKQDARMYISIGINTGGTMFITCQCGFGTILTNPFGKTVFPVYARE